MSVCVEEETRKGLVLVVMAVMLAHFSFSFVVFCCALLGVDGRFFIVVGHILRTEESRASSPEVRVAFPGGFRCRECVSCRGGWRDLVRMSASLFLLLTPPILQSPSRYDCFTE